MKKYAKYGHATCRGFSPWKGGGCILVTNLPLTTLFIEYAIFELYLPLRKTFLMKIGLIYIKLNAQVRHIFI